MVRRWVFVSRCCIVFVLATVPAVWAGAVTTQIPKTLAAPAQSVIVTYHAEGAQIYECKAGSDGALTWTFREPIATLLLDGKTAGRHYAGPTWELSDGSIITGKTTASAPGATADDIPWLKLEVASRRGNGLLSGVTTIQRLNTVGGVLTGPCDQVGSFRSAQYSADYSFLGGRNRNLMAKQSH
jgi:hypothetical protein